MSARDRAGNFRNQAEFFEEIAEKGKAASSEDKKAVFHETPFAAIRSETYPESKFREILTRIIANETSAEESRAADFETEQIKRIPQILMCRIDARPSIEELAHELMMNTTTMKKGFKKIFGSPIYAYHRDMCLELAAAMLLDTKKPVFEIAIDVGYSCSVNFCYAFKKRYGISPGRYRRNGKSPL
jgi:AraC-like DNA-binding protein